MIDLNLIILGLLAVGGIYAIHRDRAAEKRQRDFQIRCFLDKMKRFDRPTY